MRKIKSIAFCVLLLALVISSLFIFTACNDEPTETVSITYEKRDDGVLITGYEGVLASDTVLNVPSEIDGATVIAIADEAFRGKDDLKKIILPATVVAIGEGAFKNCENLESVNIPTGVSEIKNDTFYGCKSLKVVDLPENIRSIGEDAFKKCNSIEELTAHGWAISYFDITSLKALNIRGDLDISFGMFSECKRLETLTIPFVGSDIDATADTHFGYIFGASDYSENSAVVPSTLTKVVLTGGKIIDDYAFFGCQSIVTVMLPKSIETIGEGAFEGCLSLEKATIPALTGYIGPDAFSGTSLKSATIPSRVTTIEANTFLNCDKLESITITEGVTEIKPGAFIGCTSLSSLDVASIEQWLSFEFASCYDSPLFYAGKLSLGGKEIDEITIPKSITKIPDNAFYRCSNIKSVRFNDTLTEIGSYAFAGCVNLNSITFPASLTKIGTASFTNCTSIESLTIGENVTEIGEYAFNLNSSLKTLTFSANVTTLPEAIFRECGLSSVTITSAIDTVSESSFSGSNRIKTVKAPLNVIEILNKESLVNVTILDGEAIQNELFVDAKNLTEIALPSSIKTIGNNSFYGCYELRSVSIPEDSELESIKDFAFADCFKLTSFVLTANVNEIGLDAFSGCYKLAEVYNLSALDLYANTQSYITAYAYSVKASLDTPSSLIEDGNYIFVDNNGEKILLGYFGKSSVIELPADINGELYSINKFAFKGSDLRVITVPPTVTSAHALSFSDMNSLVELEAPVSVIEMVDKATASTITTLYVTAGDDISGQMLTGFASLKTLRLGAGVKTIDALALASSLPELSEFIVDNGNTVFKTIEGNLYEILANGDKLVRACPKSTDYFTLPITTYEIGDYAFFGCEGLNTLYIEEGSVLAKIGEFAFVGASSIYSLELPSTITEIGYGAFIGCLYLSEIEFTGVCERYSIAGGCLIDNSTKTVIRAFGNKGVCEIPATVTTIATSAFSGQSTITKIVLPSSILINDSAFIGLSALEEIIVDPANTEYKVVDGCLIKISTGELVLATIYAKIPTDGSVTKILSGAFSGNSAITSVVIPESVTKIDSYAFWGCTSLTTITVPASLLPYITPDYITNLIVTGAGAIDKETLSAFTALESITIGKGVSGIEEGAFENAKALTKIEVDAENTSLKATGGALIDIASKTVIALTPGAVIPADGSATKIGAYAFANKENAISLSIPAEITEIASTAFENTFGLKALEAPVNFLYMIPSSEVTSLKITGGSEILGSDLIYLSKLESLTIGKTITAITPGAFITCEKLREISVDSENTSYKALGGALIEIATGTVILGVGNTTLPLDGIVKAIADYAFYNNTELTELVIPTSVTYYGVSSLEGCTSLKRVFIPAGVMEEFISTTLVGVCEFYEYSEAKPETEGNFWYIEDGSVKIWW